MHIDCQYLAVNDCCETAQYVPNRPLHNLKQNHHWREGNLPTNSKCIVCKKTCWTSECLAGMKCEWCGITAHSICRTRLMDECNFGSLRDIIVPPFAVSVPRIEMNKEAILGIQTTRGGNSKNAVTTASVCANNYSVDLNSSTAEVKSESNSDQSVYSSHHHHHLQQPQASTDLNDTNNSPGFSYLPASPSFLTNLTSMTATQPPPNATTTTTTTALANASTTPGSSSNFSNATSVSNSISSTSQSARKKDRSSKVNHHHHHHHQQTVDEDEEDVIIQVYDGNTSLRKRVFRTIAVRQHCSYLAILEVSLRTFHINDDPNNYYLSVPVSSSSGKQTNLASSGSSAEDYQPEEYLIDETCPIKSIRTLNSGGSSAACSPNYSSSNSSNPSGNSAGYGNSSASSGGVSSHKLRILLRYKDNECENIRIYPGTIK